MYGKQCGRGKGVVYVMSPGRPTDIGLQLARPAVLEADNCGGGWMFLFLLFTVIHFPLSPLSLSFISSAISSISLLPSSGKQHKMTHKGWHVAKPQHNQRPWSDATFCCIWSGCTLFAKAYLSQLIDWLSWGLMTLQPLWVILCRLPEKVEDR